MHFIFVLCPRMATCLFPDPDVYSRRGAMYVGVPTYTVQANELYPCTQLYTVYNIYAHIFLVENN